MSEENVSLLMLAVGTALIYDHQLPRKKKRRKRRYWVKPWLEKRYERSAYKAHFSQYTIIIMVYWLKCAFITKRISESIFE